jgi:tetratricopeptide (TPR) repeat protein
VSGRVLQEDGTPPTESVTIERICSGSPHAEGYTDTRGYFSFELGRTNTAAVLQDASEDVGRYGLGSGGGFGNMTGSTQQNNPLGNSGSAGGTSEFRYANCDLRARLAGYRSQTVSLANRRPMDNPDIGVILLHRIAPTEGSIVSANSLRAPKDAKKAFDKGLEAQKKNKTDDAMKNYEKAVELYPEYAAAWQEIGRLQMAKGDKTAAAQSFDAAMKADPKFVPPLVEVAMLQAQAQNWEQVVATTDKAIKLDAFDYPQLFFFNAVANYNLHNLDVAEQNARQAEKLDTRHQIPRASHLLALILEQRKDYTAAADEFKTYLKLSPNATDAAEVRAQIDRMEKLTAQAKQDQ